MNKTSFQAVAIVMALAFFTSGSVMAKGAGKEHAAEKPGREKPAAEKPVGEKSKVGVERPEFLTPLRPVAREATPIERFVEKVIDYPVGVTIKDGQPAARINWDF